MNKGTLIGLILSVLIDVAPVEAISCAGVADVTALPSAGCTANDLVLSNFQVSASAGFAQDSVTVGIGTVLTTSDGTSVRFQLTTPGVGPGDVLLAYRVDVPGSAALSAVDLANNAVVGPVIIGELVCRTAITPGSTCAAADRLATLVANVGEHVRAKLTEAADPAFIFKDASIGAGGFISDLTNSHLTAGVTPSGPPVVVPEPATLVLLGLSGLGAVLVKRRRK